MLPSVRALLSGIIDYAGLFPPAQLPLEQAIRNYARYRTGPESWMLGRFVCPAARLVELTPFINELFRDGAPLAVSALGRGRISGRDFLTDLQSDLECVRTFCRLHSGRVVVDVFEVRASPEQLNDQYLSTVEESWLELVANTMPELRSGRMRLFFELGLNGDWLDRVEDLMQAFAHARRWYCNPESSSRDFPFGFKLRCGGTEASAFPSVGQITLALQNCIEFGISFKATAGLHHAVRRYDAQLGTYMHGFLNVWIASLALSLGSKTFHKAMIPVLLEDRDASHFSFDEAGVNWRNLRIPTEVITRGRTQFSSFGSCSFDEPRDDLRAMGLLP
jgi:hypothetical protein